MKGRGWKAVGLIGLLAILAILMVASNGESILRLVIAVPFVLILPGYALTGLLFDSETLGRAEKLLFTLSLSLVAAALGGFMLHWTPGGLQVWTWTLLLAGITLVAGSFALRKGKRFALAFRPKPGMAMHILLFGIAGLIVVAAMAIAREGAAKRLSAPVAQLWILPVEPHNRAFELGVANLESQTVEFRLRIELDDNLFRELPSITLEPDQKWEMTLWLPPELPTPGTITALLYREDAPDSVYRKVVLRPPG